MDPGSLYVHCVQLTWLIEKYLNLMTSEINRVNHLMINIHMQNLIRTQIQIRLCLSGEGVTHALTDAHMHDGSDGSTEALLYELRHAKKGP